MRECSNCGSTYDDDTLVCPLDNTRTQVRVSLGLTDNLPKPGAQLGAYTLLSVIGHGASGVVYLANHARLGRKFALKLLRPELNGDPLALRRFFDEARAIEAIQHQNIVKVADLVEDGDFKYLVMEHLKGTQLDEVIRTEGPLPVARVLHIGRQIASALAAAHAVGVVHRDLKPQNIFVIRKDGDPDFAKVLDFGVAKMQSSSVAAAQTVAGSLVGTPAYMAPEQLAEGLADHRADIYAIGVLLFEMAAKQRPFSAPTLWELIPQLIADPAPRLRTIRNACRGDLPRGLDELVDHCLRKKREDRPQTAQELAEKLYALEREAAEMPTRLARSDEDMASTALDVIKSLGALSSDANADVKSEVRTAPDAKKDLVSERTEPERAPVQFEAPATSPELPVDAVPTTTGSYPPAEAFAPPAPAPAADPFAGSPTRVALARVQQLPPVALWAAGALLFALGLAALWAVITS